MQNFANPGATTPQILVGLTLEVSDGGSNMAFKLGPVDTVPTVARLVRAEPSLAIHSAGDSLL